MSTIIIGLVRQEVHHVHMYTVKEKPPQQSAVGQSLSGGGKLFLGIIHYPGN